MRFNDHPSCSIDGFRAGHAIAGGLYRSIGFVLVAAATVAIGLDAPAASLAGLLGIGVSCWFAAWWQTVGALYRAPLVAGCLVCVVGLSLQRIGGLA